MLVDANVLMYALGKPHLHKAASAAFIERVAAGVAQAAIDAETLQEILHRYRSIGRWQEGQVAYSKARLVFSQVLPITAEIMDLAVRLLDRYPTLVARDAVHAAAALGHGLDAICSFDHDFDQIRELERVEPV